MHSKARRRHNLKFSAFVLRLIVFSIAFLGILFSFTYFFADALQQSGDFFTSKFGATGISLAFFVQDFTSIPIPSDLTTLAARIGGFSFVECVFWGSLGSILGSLSAFHMARHLHDFPAIHAWLSRRRMKQVYVLVRTHGVKALLIGALTPLPFSTFCWVSGAFGLRLSHFVIVVFLLRPLRVAAFLMLVELGVINLL